MFKKIICLWLAFVLLFCFCSCKSNKYFKTTGQKLKVEEISSEVFSKIKLECTANGRAVNHNLNQEQIKDLYNSLKLKTAKTLTPKPGFEQYINSLKYIGLCFSTGINLNEQYGYFAIYENDLAYESLSQVIDGSHYFNAEKGTYEKIDNLLKKK